MRNKILVLVFGAIFAFSLPLLLSAEEVTKDQNKKVRQRTKSERPQKGDKSKKVRRPDKPERPPKAPRFSKGGQGDGLAQRGERANIDFSSMNPDEIIEAIKNRQATVIERMKSRNEKLSERINMHSDRREKMADRKNQKEPRKGRKGSPEDRSKRYESFKENVQNRQAKMAEFAEKRRVHFVKQISHLEEADQQKVISAYDKLSEQFKADIETITAEAQKKIEEAFKGTE